MSRTELAGKVALVTGGSRGIGRAIVCELAGAGATVAFTYQTSAHGAEATRKQVEESGGICTAYPCDVSDFDAAKALVEQVVQEHGRLDVLVNNAGITRDNLILRMTPDDFDAVVRTNLRGTWNLCKSATRTLVKARGGRIVNVSSVVAQMGNPGQTNYAASKGGVEAFTRSLAKELGSRGITVNAVAPGFIDTDMTAVLADQVKAALVDRIPLGRLGSVEDVARVVRFLASENAAYITGQVIAVNGGLD